MMISNLIVAVLLKPLVFMLNVFILAKLWKSWEKISHRYFYIAFVLLLIGELFCAIDVYLLQQMSLLNEGMHDVFMAFSFGIFIIGAYMYTQENYRCWNDSCSVYWECKIIPADCSQSTYYGRFFGWLLMSLAIMGIFPVFADVSIMQKSLYAGFANTIYGLYEYSRQFPLIALQQKIIPLAGMFSLLGAGLIYLRMRCLNRSMMWMAGIGSGLILFSYFRLFLVQFFKNQVEITTFGEEILEALFLALFLLWYSEKKRITRAGYDQQKEKMNVA